MGTNQNLIPMNHKLDNNFKESRNNHWCKEAQNRQ